MGARPRHTPAAFGACGELGTRVLAIARSPRAVTISRVHTPWGLDFVTPPAAFGACGELGTARSPRAVTISRVHTPWGLDFVTPLPAFGACGELGTRVLAWA